MRNETPSSQREHPLNLMNECSFSQVELLFCMIYVFLTDTLYSLATCGEGLPRSSRRLSNSSLEMPFDIAYLRRFRQDFMDDLGSLWIDFSLATTQYGSDETAAPL
jgi:hypothetical protein